MPEVSRIMAVVGASIESLEQGYKRADMLTDQLASSMGSKLGRASASTAVSFDKLGTSVNHAFDKVNVNPVLGDLAALDRGAAYTGKTMRLDLAKGADTAAVQVRKAGDAFDDAGTQASRFGEITTGAFRRIGAGAVEMGVRAVGELVDLGQATVSVAGDFQASLNRFSSVAGESLADAGLSVKDFSDLALDMGAKTAFSAGEAADAMNELVRGGVDPLTQKAGGLRASLDLAAAGEIELANAAEIGAKQLGIWVDASADAEEKARFLASTSGLLAQAANASTVGVSDLAQGLAQSGLAAKASGVDYDELVTTMALLAPGFSSASDAGTSLKTLIASMPGTTGPARAAMIELGLATEDGKSKFFDAQGAFIGMEAAMALLQKQTSGLSDEQRNMAFNTIFGSDAIRAATLLAERGADGYRKMTDDMSKAGTAAEQAAKRNQGFNFAVESLTGSMETLGIVVGTAALPAITGFITDTLIPGANAATDFARAVSESNNPLSVFTSGLDRVAPGLGTAVDLTATLASGLDDALVPALYAASTAATVYGAASLPKATTATIAAAKATAGWVAALGPVGLLAGAGAAAIGLMTWQMQRHTEHLDALADAQLATNLSMQANIDTVKEFSGSSAAETDRGQALVDNLKTLERQYRETTRAKADMEEQVGGRPLEAGDVGYEAYQELNKELHSLTNRMSVARDGMSDLNITAIEQAQSMEAVHAATAQYAAMYGAVGTAAGDASTAIQNYTDEQREALEKLSVDLGKINDDIFTSLDKTAGTQASFYDDSVTAGRDHLQEMYDLQAGYQDQRAQLEKDLQKATTDAQRAAINERLTDLDKGYADQVAKAEAGYAGQAAAAGIAYAREREQLRAHLAEMLLARIENRKTELATDNDPSNDFQIERLDALATGVREQFGLMPSEADAAMAAANQSFVDFEKNSKVPIEQAKANFTNAMDAAIDKAAAMKRIADDVFNQKAEILVELRDTGQITPEEYNRQIEKLPREVKLEMVARANIYDAQREYQALYDYASNPPMPPPITAIADTKEASDRYRELYDYAAKVPEETKTTVTTNAGDAAQAYKDFKTAQMDIAADTGARITSNADDEAVKFQRVVDVIGKLPPSTAANVTTDAPNATGAINDVTAAAAGVPASTPANIQSNAATVAAEIRGVVAAVNTVPAVKMVRIQAMIDGDLKRRSPSPIEQTMSAIDEFTKRAHTVKVDTTGMAQLKETLSVMAQMGSASESLMKVEGFQAPSDTSLRSFFASANDTAQLARGYALGWTKEIADATNVYLDSANKAVSVIGSGTEALSKLPDYAGVSRDDVLRFSNDLHGTVSTLAVVVRDFDRDGLAAAALWTDSAKDVVSIIGTGVDNLSKLPDYAGVTRAQVLRFGYDVYGTVSTLAVIVRDFDRDGLAAADQWSASADKVLGVIGDGVESLTAIRKYRGLSRDAVLLFGHDLYGTVSTLQVIVRDFDRDGMEAANEWSDSAKGVVGLVGTGVDALTKISDYEGVTQAQVYLFAHDIKEAVWALESVARDFDHDGTEAAGEWSASAGKVVGLIGEGVEGLQGISKHKGVSQDAVYAFARDVKEVVWALESVARDFDADGTEAAANWSTSVATIIAPISDGVEAFDALRDLAPIPAQKIDILVAGMALAAERMGEAASRIDEDMLAEATRFADASGKILAPIDTAIDTFTSLKDYEGVAPGAIRLIANDMVGTVGLMTSITSSLDTEGAEAAAEFATVAGTIFDGVGKGIDTLTALREYEGVAPERFQVLASDFDQMVAMVRTMRERADITAREAMTFKEHVETAAGRIRLAFEAISDLDGLTVHAEIKGTIHGSVSAGTSPGAPGVPGAPSTPSPPADPLPSVPLLPFSLGGSNTTHNDNRQDNRSYSPTYVLPAGTPREHVDEIEAEGRRRGVWK